MGQFVSFQIFETFRNLGVDFSIKLNKCFWKLSILLKFCYFSVKFLTHDETYLKYVAAMSLHQAYVSICICIYTKI